MADRPPRRTVSRNTMQRDLQERAKRRVAGQGTPRPAAADASRDDGDDALRSRVAEFRSVAGHKTQKHLVRGRRRSHTTTT